MLAEAYTFHGCHTASRLSIKQLFLITTASKERKRKQKHSHIASDVENENEILIF